MDDAVLMSLLKDGDEHAFKKIYERHWHALYKSSFLVLKDKEACTDIVQELFIWVWQHRDTMEVINLKAYLSAAVKFKVANHIRAGKSREKHYLQHTGFQTNSRLSVDEEIELKELKRLVSHTVSGLPSKCREIYRLSRDYGFSNKEISTQLSISAKTVENQLTIALKRIRSVIYLLLPFLALISFGL